MAIWPKAHGAWPVGASYDACVPRMPTSPSEELAFDLGEVCRWSCSQDVRTLMENTTRHYPLVWPCRAEWADAVLHSSRLSCSSKHCVVRIELLFAEYLRGVVSVTVLQADGREAQQWLMLKRRRCLSNRCQHTVSCSSEARMMPLTAELSVAQAAAPLRVLLVWTDVGPDVCAYLHACMRVHAHVCIHEVVNLCMRVRARMRACVRACVRARMRACVLAGVRACMCECRPTLTFMVLARTCQESRTINCTRSGGQSASCAQTNRADF